MSCCQISHQSEESVWKGPAAWKKRLLIRPTEAGDPRPGYGLIQILNTATDSYTMGALVRQSWAVLAVPYLPCALEAAFCSQALLLLHMWSEDHRYRQQVLSLVAVGDWSRAGALRMSQHNEQGIRNLVLVCVALGVVAARESRGPEPSSCCACRKAKQNVSIGPRALVVRGRTWQMGRVGQMGARGEGWRGIGQRSACQAAFPGHQLPPAPVSHGASCRVLQHAPAGSIHLCRAQNCQKRWCKVGGRAAAATLLYHKVLCRGFLGGRLGVGLLGRGMWMGLWAMMVALGWPLSFCSTHLQPWRARRCLLPLKVAWCTHRYSEDDAEFQLCVLELLKGGFYVTSASHRKRISFSLTLLSTSFQGEESVPGKLSI